MTTSADPEVQAAESTAMIARETGREIAKAEAQGMMKDGKNNLPLFLGKSYEEHVSSWIDIGENLDEKQWQLGAIAASLKKKWGDETIKKFSADVGAQPSTVYEYAQVYRFYEDLSKKGKPGRSETLSFSHHVKAMGAANPRKLLAQAEDENLSVRQMVKLIGDGDNEKAPAIFYFKHDGRKKGQSKDTYKKVVQDEFKRALNEFVEVH